MITLEKMLLLKKVTLFKYTRDDILLSLAARAEEMSIEANENIIEQQEVGNVMYVIVTGEVRVHDGDTELARLGESDVFGELAALVPCKRIASVTAQSDCVLLKIDHECLYDLMELNFELCKGIIHFLVERVRAIA